MSTNPFINRLDSARKVEQDIEDEFSEAGVNISHGPTRPLAHNSTLAGDLPIKKQPVTSSALVHVTGVHGGAGVTTLCTLLKSDAKDSGGLWGQANPWVPQNTGLTLLAARTHGRGLDALHTALTAWHQGAYSDAFALLGVCIIDDAPRLNKVQTERIKTLMGMAPHTWRMPWVESYRIQTEELSAPLGIRRLVNSIRRHAKNLNMKGKNNNDTSSEE